MKIAVTTENEEVFQHFGQSRTFTIFTAESGEITKKVTLDAGESGHSALAGLLKNLAIDVVICGGIGGGARQMLASAGIQLVSGVTGSVDKAVEAFLKGELKDQGETCDHHDHEHGHDCHGHDHSHGHDCSCHAPVKINVKIAEQ
jgi:predicted Fe-Mo cluster-binding NifX family protein